MTDGALFWVVVFGAAAMLFFGIAVVAGYRGFLDLRDLLSSSDRAQPEKEADRGREA